MIGLTISVVLLIIIFFFEIENEKYYSSLEIRDLLIPATSFIKAVLLDLENRFPSKKPYSFEVKYYLNKSVMGRYYFNNNTMEIYLTKSTKLIELTDTIAHEYCHHLQNHSKKQDINFALKLYETEYENHPWEVEAREFASRLSLKILKKIIK
jgi:Zn-dependent peptidase ImmA (M78 family)